MRAMCASLMSLEWPQADAPGDALHMNHRLLPVAVGGRWFESQANRSSACVVA